MEKTGFCIEGRVLCSDEACIGTVGPDGRCKVCGLEYTGDEPVLATDGADGDSDEEAGRDAAKDHDQEAPGETRGDDDPDERVCCPDDACIGLIGPDGKCGTCGRTA